MAVTGDSRVGGGLRGWSGNDESRGSDPTIDGRRASRLLVSGAAGRAGQGIKKAGGPDLAHGSWFVRMAVLPPADRSGGHRSPVCDGAIGRNASGEERLRHHLCRLLLRWIRARDMRAGRQSTRAADGVSTRTDDDGRTATDDVGAGYQPPSRPSRTIGRTGVEAFHWRRSTTENPARSNMPSVPWNAFAAGTRPAAVSTG